MYPTSPVSPYQTADLTAAYQQASGYPSPYAYPPQQPQQQAYQYPQAPQAYGYPAADTYGYPQQQPQLSYSQPASYSQPQPQFQQPQFQVAPSPSSFMDPSQSQAFNPQSFMPSQLPTQSMPVLTPPSPATDKYSPSLAPAPAPMEVPPSESPSTSNSQGAQQQDPSVKPPKPGKSLFPRIVGLGALAAAIYIGYRYLFKGDGNNADDLKGDNVFTEPLKSYIQDKIKGTNVTEHDYNGLKAKLELHNKQLSADDKISDGSFSDELGRALNNMIEHGEEEGLKTKAEQLLAIKTKLEESATQTPVADEVAVATAKPDTVAKPAEEKTEDKKADKKADATKTA